MLSEPDCINEVDALGRNALMYAVHFEHLDTVQHLLERNIEINATTVGKMDIYISSSRP